MQTKDWPVVIAARDAAKEQLSFYTRMMSIKTTKPERNPPRLLTDTTEGIYPIYAQQYLRRVMCTTYRAYDSTHVCEQCKLKT